MTKKDFQLIATVFKQAREDAVDKKSRLAGDVIALRMARELKTTNPRFDADRFLNACGIPSTEINQWLPLFVSIV